jgi:hypothetical protein
MFSSNNLRSKGQPAADRGHEPEAAKAVWTDGDLSSPKISWPFQPVRSAKRSNGKIPMNYSLARTPDALDQVYRLRYSCYRRNQSIDERPDQRFPDGFDDMPNQFSFLARTDEQSAMATVRLSVVRPDRGWIDSPGARVFGDHPAFKAIGSYVEASRLCFGAQARRDAFIGLLGNMAALAEFYKVDWLVACPRVEHVPVYEKLFGFEPLAAPRQYFGVRFETQLLGIRMRNLEENVRDRRVMKNSWQTALEYLRSVLSDVA